MEVKVFQVGDIVHLLSHEPYKEDVVDLGLRYLGWDSDDLEDRCGMECRIVGAQNTPRDIQERGGKYDVVFEDNFETVLFGYDIVEFYDEIVEAIDESDLIGLLGGM